MPDFGEQDFCHTGYGNGDTYPRPGYDPAKQYPGAPPQGPPAYYFVCPDRADNIVTFACTGSKHLNNVEIRCSCKCHALTFPVVAQSDRRAVEGGPDGAST